MNVILKYRLYMRDFSSTTVTSRITWQVMQLTVIDKT